ncbi:MAG: ABC transporter permease [Erysipelotrichaceae bacterium]|nr:ABC transporter permease [Erysipelotrichaceae bacterium]
MNNEKKKSFLERPGVQSVAAALICVAIGLFIGFIVLYLINPAGAGDAIVTILLNFFTRASSAAQLKAFGNTLAKTAPLLMCALSVCFCYKVGLFNIGAPGQYEAGACAALFAALAWNLPWYICIIMAAIAGALLGAVSGILKAYRNVNEVISGIMLNWITLYVCNMVLSSTSVKDAASPYSKDLTQANPGSIIPSWGLNALFPGNKAVTIAIPLAIIFAILVWVILNKTKFGYELKATGYNKEGARYAGMKEKRNIIITLIIGGALAGLGAAFLYLTNYIKWETTATSVPGMGFNGIAATFLGGLNPIGTIFSSFFIQSISDGGSLIDRMIYPSQISDLISGIIIYLCGFTMFFKYIMSKRRIKKEEEKIQSEKTKEGGDDK